MTILQFGTRTVYPMQKPQAEETHGHWEKAAPPLARPKERTSTSETAAPAGKGAAVVDETNKEVAAETDARFYAPLGRHVVPIADAGLHSYSEGGGGAVDKAGYAPGTLIQCVLRYSHISRQVISVHDTSVMSGAPIVEKRVGLVSRLGLRLRVPGSPSTSPRERGGGGVGGGDTGSGVPEEGLELLELRNQEDYAYCLWPTEVAAPAGSVNTNISQTLSMGDQVEYYQYTPPPSSSSSSSSKPFLMALAATAMRRSGASGGVGKGSMGGGGGDTGGIVFRGPGFVNADLQKSMTKQTASKISGKIGVVMAKGPAEDGSTGFEPGWRTQERINEWTTLPWAHLLPWPDLAQSGAGAK